MRLQDSTSRHRVTGQQVDPPRIQWQLGAFQKGKALSPKEAPLARASEIFVQTSRGA